MSIVIKVEANGEARTVRLEGALDLETADEAKQAIKRLLEQGHVSLILDLEDLRYIDSTGLGVLIGAFKKVQERKGTFVLHTNPRIQRILDETRLSRIFQVQQ